MLIKFESTEKSCIFFFWIVTSTVRNRDELAIAGKFTYFAEQKKSSYPASFQGNFKVNEKFIFTRFLLLKGIL